jgi:tRNA/tmRNA/rRNA uracil-C5-methylase (TrmA/RlmC/RlmD family)
MTLPLSCFFEWTVGIDHEAQSIQDAWATLHYNQAHLHAQGGCLDSLDFKACDGRRGLAKVSQEKGIPEIVLVHAMRKPLSGLLTLAHHLKIPRILYIAPSAPAFARDWAEEKGYTIQKIHFVDQMPGTAQALSLIDLKWVADSEE